MHKTTVRAKAFTVVVLLVSTRVVPILFNQNTKYPSKPDSKPMPAPTSTSER